MLEKLKDAAERALGRPVTRAVVTVPAYFDEAQRQATRDAGTIAGLDVVRLVNEPTAAALAYGLQKAQGERAAVVDLGGGTFDATVMMVEDGVFEVLATGGDMLLGGDDFDRLLARILRDEVKREQGVDPGSDPVAAQRILDEAEALKRQLSELPEALVALPYLLVGPSGPVNFVRTVTREELEALCTNLVARLEEPCRAALSDARLQPGDVEHVILVGRMTRMPLVERRLAEIFRRRPRKDINPDEAVALGAALETAILEGALAGVVLVDVAPHTLGVRAAGDRMVPAVRRGTPVPARVRKVFATTADHQDHVLVEIWQGEDPRASRNRKLARFRLGDLPKAPRGQVHVEVTFSLHASGLLQVTARERTSGREAHVDVLGHSGLGREEVARLAKEHAARRAQ